MRYSKRHSKLIKQLSEIEFSQKAFQCFALYNSNSFSFVRQGNKLYICEGSVTKTYFCQLKRSFRQLIQCTPKIRINFYLSHYYVQQAVRNIGSVVTIHVRFKYVPTFFINLIFRSFVTICVKILFCPTYYMSPKMKLAVSNIKLNA